MSTAFVFASWTTAGINPRSTLADVLDGRASLRDALSTGPENLHVLCGGSGLARLADTDVYLLDQLQRELASYLTYYNHQRAHTARITKGATPADLVHGARKMQPR